MIDNRTPHFDLPLPDSSNLLSEDVGRITQALIGIDTVVHNQTAVNADFATNLQSQVEQQLESETLARQTAEQNLTQEVNTQLAKLRILALAGL